MVHVMVVAVWVVLTGLLLCVQFVHSLFYKQGGIIPSEYTTTAVGVSFHYGGANSSSDFYVLFPCFYCCGYGRFFLDVSQ